MDGLLAPEARFFVQRLSDSLSMKWEQPFGVVSSHPSCSFVVCAWQSRQVEKLGNCRWGITADVDSQLIIGFTVRSLGIRYRCRCSFLSLIGHLRV